MFTPSRCGAPIAGALTTTALSCLLLVASCSSGGGGGDSDTGGDSEVDIAIDTGSEGQNIALSNGVPTSVIKSFDFDLSASGPFESMAVDFSDPATLAALSTFLRLPGAVRQGSQVTAQVTFYVGAAGEITSESDCAEGEAYGPFTIQVAAGSITSVDPPTQAASAQTVSIVNRGTLVICAVITPQGDATLTVNNVPAIGGTCTETPADIAGRWVGTFLCDGDTAQQNVDLTITQTGNGRGATYVDDAMARYQGVVCGRSFSFRGGLTDSYDESGTFVMNADGETATKTSYFTTLPYSGTARGNCSDVLTRQ